MNVIFFVLLFSSICHEYQALEANSDWLAFLNWKKDYGKTYDGLSLSSSLNTLTENDRLNSLIFTAFGCIFKD